MSNSIGTAPVIYQGTVTGIQLDFSLMNTTDAMNAIVARGPDGQPQLNPDAAAQFNALPADQQAALINRWLEVAKSGDGELKVAALFAVSKLVNASTASATRNNFEAVRAQVASTQPYELPVRINTPEVRDARARLREGRATEADIQRLCSEGVVDLLPQERAVLAQELARRGRSTDLLTVLTRAPSVENARTALAACGGGDAWAGMKALRATVDPNGTATTGYQAAFNDVINKLPPAQNTGAATKAQEAFLIASQQPGPAAAATTASAAPADSAAPKAATPTTISAAQAQANYQHLATQLASDGQVSVGEQLLLIEEALDSNHYYQKLMAGDPEFLALLKQDPGYLETVKTVIAAMNAAKDALIAIHDDMNNRRKKYAESLGRIA